MLKITAIGNLTHDVELKMNETTGKPYAILRIASDRRYKDKAGNRLTDFISIKVRGPLAERCAEFAWKGCKLAATGDLRPSPSRTIPSASPVFSSRPAMWSSSRPARRRTLLLHWRMRVPERSLPDEKHRDHIHQR